MWGDAVWMRKRGKGGSANLPFISCCSSCWSSSGRSVHSAKVIGAADTERSIRQPPTERRDGGIRRCRFGMVRRPMSSRSVMGLIRGCTAMGRLAPDGGNLLEKRKSDSVHDKMDQACACSRPPFVPGFLTGASGGSVLICLNMQGDVNGDRGRKFFLPRKSFRTG